MHQKTAGVPLALLTAALVIAAPRAAHAQETGEWGQRAAVAARSVARLAPAAFPGMPQNVRAELTRRGCRVPQTRVPGAAASETNNAIRGNFAAARQTDWAALCSKNGASTIEIVWGGPARCSVSIRPKPDKDVMMDYSTDPSKPEWSFDRSIEAVGLAGNQAVRRDLRALRYQGITDGWEGGSATLVCRAGRWLVLEVEAY